MRGTSCFSVIGFLVFLCGAVAAQPMPAAPAEPGRLVENAAPLTLDEAMRLAFAGSHAVSSARHQALASEGVLLQSRVLPNPVLNVQVEDTSRKSTRKLTSTLDVPVELGGKRGARLAAAELGRQVAASELRKARADLRFRVVSAFFKVLAAQERMELVRGTTRLAHEAARVAKQRVAAGKVPPLEADRAQVELVKARLEQDEAVHTLALARRALSALWGNASPAFTRVEGDFEAVPQRPVLDNLAAALARSPVLEAARLAADQSRARLEVERSKRSPDLTVSVGAVRDYGLGRNQAVVGVSLPLPLFDRNQGNVYEASMQVYKRRDEYRELEVQLMTQLQQVAGEFDLAARQADRFRDGVLPVAETAYERARNGFGAGKYGFTEVLDAQRTLFAARAGYLVALSDVYQALAQIQHILDQE